MFPIGKIGGTVKIEKHRHIMPIGACRKACTGIIIKRIRKVWDKNQAISPCNSGFARGGEGVSTTEPIDPGSNGGLASANAVEKQVVGIHPASLRELQGHGSEQIAPLCGRPGDLHLELHPIAIVHYLVVGFQLALALLLLVCVLHGLDRRRRQSFCTPPPTDGLTAAAPPSSGHVNLVGAGTTCTKLKFSKLS